jgi:hypothetical protein
VCEVEIPIGYSFNALLGCEVVGFQRLFLFPLLVCEVDGFQQAIIGVLYLYVR